MAAQLDLAVLAACDAQAASVGRWLDSLSAADLELPSSLPGWRVAELAMHLAQAVSAVPLALTTPRPARGTRALTITEYTSAFAAAAPEIFERELAAAASTDLAGTRQRLVDELARLHQGLDALRGVNVVVAGTRGPIRVNDLLRTRANELIAHSIDAGRSIPGRPGPELEPAALKIAVRMLAEVLADRYPGRSVEVRVPPYAAVQIGDGPVHKRGTPPNVVETDPATFVALATGRTGFVDAFDAGVVRASGARADLSAYFPVLA
jgi:uncharacterized protein (TIGR03083 family)